MTHLNDLPTDSVLRRHALTERNRALGLPPTDSVLRRHHEQWLAAQAAAPAAAPAQAAVPAPAATRPSAPVPAPAARMNPPAAPAGRPPTPPIPAPAPPASGGGLMGWLRRIFGL